MPARTPRQPGSATTGCSEGMPGIAVFSLTFPPFVGGAEVAICEIAKRCPRHHFTVVTARLRRQPALVEAGNLRIVRVGFGWWLDKYLYPWLAVRAAVSQHRRQPFTLIWGMMASWGGLAALRFKERCPQLPYVLTEQSGDSDWFIARRTWFWLWRYRQIYRRANAVTAISKFLAARATRSGARQVTVVPNGVDVARFSQPVGSSVWQEFRSRLQLAAGPCVISVSRLVEKNGLDVLIAAIALLRRRHVTVNLLVVGTGPLAPRLHAQVRRLDLGHAVKFCGHVTHDDLPHLLQEALVFVRPSRSEGFGNALVEAMAAGVPVVATPVGGIVDFIQDGVTGLFCRPHDPSSVAAAIERLVHDEGLRQQLSAQARRLVRERYDWSLIARQMDQVFTQVIARV